MSELNWAGNYRYTAARLHRAESVEELQDLVSRTPHLRALGSRHSFNDIADTSGTLVETAALNRAIGLDEGRRRVTVEGGIRYGDLALWLHERGWALANLASLPHISVAGAVATATHGSGLELGNLATSVAALEIVTAGGDILALDRDRDADFAGAVVALGALGIVARLSLDVEPTYLVRQDVFTDLPFDAIVADFDGVFGGGTSVSVFTDWRGERTRAAWVKTRVERETDPGPGSEFHGGTHGNTDMNPVPGGAAEVCTPQMGVPGPWHERLPHFRMGFTPSHGAEIQAELFVPREEAARAVTALRGLGERLADVLMIGEIRTVAADDLWLSPGQRGPYAGFHFTFHRDGAGVQAVLPAIEQALAPFGAVPHWGKVTTMDAATIAARTPLLANFRDLTRTHDPDGKFRNGYLDRMIFAA